MKKMVQSVAVRLSSGLGRPAGVRAARREAVGTAETGTQSTAASQLTNLLTFSLMRMGVHPGAPGLLVTNRAFDRADAEIGRAHV